MKNFLQYAVRQNSQVLQGTVGTNSESRQIVLMLFDGYLRFTTAAKNSFNEDLTKKNEGINNNLIRAQNIVTELQSSLDMSVPGELPGTLYRLYDYVLHQLQQANLQKTRNN